MIKLSHYYKPTPVKWRKIGDALLGISSLITGGGLLAFDQLTSVFNPHELKMIIGGAFLLGIAGKFITNMVKPDEVKPEEEKQS